MTEFFCRPVGLKSNLLHAMQQVLGVTLQDLKQIAVNNVEGTVRAWPLMRTQLRTLAQNASFQFRNDYLLYQRSNPQVLARPVTTVFVDHLRSDTQSILRIRRMAPRTRRSEPYDYFIRVEGDFPETLREFLESWAVGIDEGNLVSLSIQGSAMRVQALPVEKEILLALHSANRLNDDWRRVRYLCRPKNVPSASAKVVPRSVFRPNKEEARRAVAGQLGR